MKTQTITSSLNKTQRILVTLAVAGMISGASFATTAFVSAANHNDTDTAEIEDQILELLIEDDEVDAVGEPFADGDEPLHYGEDDDRPYSERAHESGVADMDVTATEGETPVTTSAPMPISAPSNDPIGQVLGTVVDTVNTIQANLESGDMTEEEAEQLITDLLMVVSLLAALTSQ